MTQSASARPTQHTPLAGSKPQWQREKCAHRLEGDVRLSAATAGMLLRRFEGIGTDRDIETEQRGRTEV
jgi:hypothetical protein